MTAFSYNTNRLLYSTAAINSYSDGLPFDSNGSLVVDIGTAAPNNYSSGYPLASSGAVAVDFINSASTYTNGFPMTSNGRMAVNADSAITSQTNGYPMASGKLAVAVDPESLALNGVAPSLVQDFVNGNYYTSDAGFTAFPYTSVRTTNAMMFDSQGRLVWGPANMIGNSEATWTTLSSATSALRADIPSPTGAATYKLIANNAVSLTGNDGFGCATPTALTTVSGTTYCYAFYAKAAEISVCRVREPTATGYRALVDLNTGIVTTENGTSGLTTGFVVTSQDAGGGWWRIIARRTAGTTTQGLNIKQGGTAGDGVSGIYLSSVNATPDDATTPQPFVATTGTAYYGPRFDYNPGTLEPRELLIERQVTNLCVRSQGVVADWTTAFGTMSDVGTQWGFNISRFTTTSSGVAQFTYITANALTPAASTVYTVSAFVKKGNHSRVQMSVSNNHFLPAVIDAYLNYNFDTNTVTLAGTGAVAGTGSAILCQDGWVRISFALTSGSAPTSGTAALFSFVDSDAAIRLAGTATVGAYFDVFGLQYEFASSVTSFIPTTGVAVTRNIDTFSGATGSWNVSGLGTMYVDYKMPIQGSGGFPALYRISDGTSNNRVQLQITTGGAGTYTTGYRIDDAGVIQMNTGTATVINYYDTTKQVINYSLNNSAGLANGGTQTLDTVCTIPATFTTLEVGAGTAGPYSFWVREVRYYPDATSSQAQRQALTAV